MSHLPQLVAVWLFAVGLEVAAGFVLLLSEFLEQTLVLGASGRTGP